MACTRQKSSHQTARWAAAETARSSILWQVELDSEQRCGLRSLLVHSKTETWEWRVLRDPMVSNGNNQPWKPLSRTGSLFENRKTVSTGDATWCNFQGSTPGFFTLCLYEVTGIRGLRHLLHLSKVMHADAERPVDLRVWTYHRRRGEHALRSIGL